MADEHPPGKRPGCLAKLLTCFLLLSAAGLGSALFFISRPQDLSDVEGYAPEAETSPVRNLPVVLRNSLDRGYPLTLTEAEINRWISRTLVAKQGGVLAGKASIEGVCVRLTEGQAEVIMIRKVFGKTVTTSMFLQVEQMETDKGVQTDILLHGGPYHESFPHPPRGGRFGQLVVPQGFLYFIRPSYQQLARAFADEITLAFEDMARISIADGKLILDPRSPESDHMGLPPGIF